MFTWNRGHDAPALSLAYVPDGPQRRQQLDDRLRRGDADCAETNRLERKAGGCDLFYPLPRRPYQRPARASFDHGKCGADGAAFDGRPEGA